MYSEYSFEAFTNELNCCITNQQTYRTVISNYFRLDGFLYFSIDLSISLSLSLFLLLLLCFIDAIHCGYNDSVIWLVLSELIKPVAWSYLHKSIRSLDFFPNFVVFCFVFWFTFKIANKIFLKKLMGWTDWTTNGSFSNKEMWHYRTAYRNKKNASHPVDPTIAIDTIYNICLKTILFGHNY